MRRFIMSAALILSLCGTGAAARQDEPRRFLDPALVPAAGREPREFVPRGWKTETDAGLVTGDLNKDGAADAVLRLVEDMPTEGADGVLNMRYRALVILLAQPGGGYRRAAVATKLLGCTMCAGVLGDPEGGTVQIEIKNGVLNVNQLSGSREATDLTQRFRYDPASRRFLLIGQDKELTDRLTGESTKESTNLLTGVRITETYKAKREGAAPSLVSRKTARVGAGRRFIEDVDYEQ